MESFYSVMYYKSNPMLDEQLAIGLFLGGGEGPWLHISDKRMKLLEDVLHRNTFLSIRRNIRAFKEKVDHYRVTKPELLLFDPHYSKEQLNELKAHSKGVIAYSEPTVINDWLNEQLKDDFVTTILGEKVKPITKKQPPFSLTWKSFCSAKRFSSFERNWNLNTLNEASLASIQLHLVDPTKKELIQGLSFDLKKETVLLRLRELTIISNDVYDYSLKLIHPKPKSKLGKQLLEEAKELFPQVDFILFSTFKENKK